MGFYPIVAKDDDAKCFVCQGPLQRHVDSKSAPGHGSRVALCLKCKKMTHYDLIGDLPKEPLVPKQNTGLFGHGRSPKHG